MPNPAAKGSFLHGYNCQLAVDATALIIVVADVTDAPNDKRQAQPRLTQVVGNTEQGPRVVSLDAGSVSEATVAAIPALGCEPLMPPARQTHGRALPAAPRGRPPAGLSVAERMRRTLRTTRGRRLDARRKTIIEPGCGQLTQGRGLRRGRQHARGEWTLSCLLPHVLTRWTARRQCRRRPAERTKVLCGKRQASYRDIWRHSV